MIALWVCSNYCVLYCSFGPAIESQLDSVPLREGVNDMLGALAYRGIPITVVL